MNETSKSTLKKDQGASKQDPLKQEITTDDTADFANEFSTSGTEKNYWKNSKNKEDSKELLL